MLMGPTATGKSEIAVELAQALDCEIISVDSAMVYRGMDIGTAKPNLQAMGGIRHYLIDIMDPSATFSAGNFRSQALSLVNEISARGHIPLFVGGTMMYFNSLINGLAQLPRADPKVRHQIEIEAQQLGWKSLHEQLGTVDPLAASHIHPNDPQRIQRALEVFRITGRSLSELCKTTPSNSLPFRILKLIIDPQDRTALHNRIEGRFLKMIKRGLIDEVNSLYNRSGLHSGLPSIRAVGYRQVWAYLDGQIRKQEMIEKAIAATRQLAKRQLTWLRRDQMADRFEFDDPQLSRTMLNKLVIQLN